MARLNILPPHGLKHDSESIHDTINSINELIRTGYAYETNSYIYFQWCPEVTKIGGGRK